VLAHMGVLMGDFPAQVARLSQDAFDTWGRFGQWLTARHGELRVNSVGHLVVPSTDTRLPFMLGVDDTEHGVVADLHSPFLVHVPAQPTMLEIVAMNSDLTSLGAVRAVNEDEAASSYSLELRHQVHAAILTQEWLLFYADLIPRLGGDLLAMLQPAIGGSPVGVH
jgi:hypothetical protein